MKIAIDIPEEVFDEICNKNYYSLKGKEALRVAVRNGTPLPKGYDSIKMVTNAEEAEEYPISEDISKGFEEFTKMMFKQGQTESEERNESARHR